MRKRILIMGLLPVLNAYAECDEEGYFDCGTTGDVKWYVSEDKTKLTVSGNGQMGNYSATYNDGIYSNSAPWGIYQDTITTVDVTPGVTSLGTYAFLAMPNISDVTLPEGLLSIGRSTFNRCYNLKNMTIPETVQELGSYSIQMTGLESIVVPQSVTTIAGLAFGYNSELKSIVIGDGVTQISSQAFEGSEDAYIYCQDNAVRTCKDLISAYNPQSLNKLRKFTTLSDGKIKVGSKIYDNINELPQYVLRRIYTIDEANRVAGEVNTVRIRYR